MRRERVDQDRLSQALAATAAEHDHSGMFLQPAFDVLHSLSHVGAPPIDGARAGELLRLLAEVAAVPNLDGALALLGSAIAEGHWAPGQMHAG